MNTDKEEARMDEMIQWFHSEYEDPAQHVSYDSGEGGYQYLNGGPYNAEEVLQEQFPNEEELATRAASRLIDEGTEWVKKGDY